MKYSKPSLTFEDQANKLIKRGLIADKKKLVRCLKSVSYYRLSGYWHPFKNDDNIFKPGANLEQIWRRYTFDRQLRLLVLDGIERIEISIRTNLIYYFSHAYGAFAYLDHNNLPNLKKQKFDSFCKTFLDEQENSREIFAQHFWDKYGDYHKCLPLWMATEVAPLGRTLTMFRGLRSSLKKAIADIYGIPGIVLESWFSSLNVIRNICAHHGRLWNKELGYKPIIPEKNKAPEWHNPVVIENNRIFSILTIIKYMLNIIAPQSDWPNRLNQLLDEYPDIPLPNMGFSDNWQDCPIWENQKEL